MISSPCMANHSHTLKRHWQSILIGSNNLTTPP
jgi:hypothetical protein